MVMFQRILTWPGRAEDAGPTVQGEGVKRLIVVPQLHRAVTSRPHATGGLTRLAKPASGQPLKSSGESLHESSCSRPATASPTRSCRSGGAP